MAQETEIKLRISDLKTLRRTLKRMGARAVGSKSGRVHESNVVFDTPEGALANRGQLLRIRTETPPPKRGPVKSRSRPRTLLTFKRPIAEESPSTGSAGENRRHKVREEFELEVANATSLAIIFEALGMKGWFRYEKYRSTFCLPSSQTWAKGLLIELDETPIGTFVELEGPPGAIDRAAGQLGYSRRDYILSSYLALYLEECRRQGRESKDMLFATGKSPR